MRIGIIGGGLTGLVLAERLTAEGHNVSVLERESRVGGLSTWQDFGPFVWDRFYHVILPSDGPLIRYVRRIDLERQLRWKQTRTGFYVNHNFYELSSNVDFLRFPLLSLWSKFRLALTILYCARIENWRKLERITVEDWLMRVSGRSTFDKFWRPLLLAKLGEHYRRVSAVFIWTYVKRLFSARDATAQKESLGYVEGGYRTVLQRICDLIESRGGDVRAGVEVGRLQPGSAGGVEVMLRSGAVERFDKVVFTGPVNVLRAIADERLVDVPRSSKDVEYLGVLCGALITRKPLTPYYILNIADDRVPFTGLIGTSTVVDSAQTAGLSLTYLPKYVLSDDALLKAPDADVEKLFRAGLAAMFPKLKDDDIVSLKIHRAVKVQPLQVIDYSNLVPQTETRHDDFFILNSAQLVANTLNNNEVVRMVESFLEHHASSFPPAAPAPALRLGSATT
jgi:protoporphyrinogen oxidase